MPIEQRSEPQHEASARSSLTASIRHGAGMAVGVASVAAVILIGLAAIDVLILVFIAVILASGLGPVVDWLRSRLPIGRGSTLLIVYGAFLGAVIGMAFVVVPVAMVQLERALAALPAMFDRAREWADTLHPAVLSRSVLSLVDAAARALAARASTAPGQVVQVGLTVAQVIVAILTLLTVVYFWLTEHARLQRYVLAFVPEPRRPGAHAAWNAAEDRLGRWVRAELILMSAIGIGAGIAYTLLGVPGSLLLGLFAGLAEGIPIIGPLLGAIPAVLVAATVSPQLALLVIVVYAVLQIIEGNVLVPIVMRNTVGISPFLVILSVLIGGAAGGFAGALLAVPIAAVGEIVIEGLQARDMPVAQDPAAAGDTDDDERAAIGTTDPALGS